MGMDYDAKLAFGYTDNQVKSGPSIWNLYSYLEDSDYTPAEIHEDGGPLLTLEQLTEATEGLSFLKISSNSEIILTLPECSYETSIYREKVIPYHALDVKEEWVEKLHKLLDLFGTVVYGPPKWFLAGEQH
jgi:hypothetical protein